MEARGEIFIFCIFPTLSFSLSPSGSFMVLNSPWRSDPSHPPSFIIIDCKKSNFFPPFESSRISGRNWLDSSWDWSLNQCPLILDAHPLLKTAIFHPLVRINWGSPSSWEVLPSTSLSNSPQKWAANHAKFSLSGLQTNHVLSFRCYIQPPPI